MIVYHGSDHIITIPVYNGSKRTNDYGYGFYTTENPELAKEWASTERSDGFANSYEIDLERMSILHLNKKPYHILNWLSILLQNRTFFEKFFRFKKPLGRSGFFAC